VAKDLQTHIKLKGGGYAEKVLSKQVNQTTRRTTPIQEGRHCRESELECTLGFFAVNSCVCQKKVSGPVYESPVQKGGEASTNAVEPARLPSLPKKRYYLGAMKSRSDHVRIRLGQGLKQGMKKSSAERGNLSTGRRIVPRRIVGEKRI